MKTFITQSDLEAYIREGRVCLPQDAVLTDSARELMQQKKLSFGCPAEKKSAENGLPEDGPEIREKIIETCLWLTDMGLVIGTWGNVSCRLADGNILITPSRVDYDKMQPEDLVVLAPDGRVVKGFRNSTSEREIHRGVLNARSDVNAVIHSHSAYAMACCAIDGGIPPISEEMAQLLGGGIPISEHFVPSEKHVELGQEICRCLGNANAILIRNHGPVCLGRTLDEARVCAQVVEKSAKMYLSLRDPGGIVEIEERWVKAGRIYFTDAYGKT